MCSTRQSEQSNLSIHNSQLHRGRQGRGSGEPQLRESTNPGGMEGREGARELNREPMLQAPMVDNYSEQASERPENTG